MKILVIQQKMIGDVLTSTILCSNLRRQFPEAEIHFMAHRNTLAVLNGHPDIDRIISFDPELRSNRSEFISWGRELGKSGYDVLIDVYGKWETNIITALIPAKVKIAYHKWYTSLFYTHPVVRVKKDASGLGLAIVHRLQLLEPLLGKPDYTKLITTPVIHLEDQEIANAKALLEQHGIHPKDRPVMVSILGSGRDKSYPDAYMARVLDLLAKELKSPLLFNYIPSQKEQVEAILGHCNAETRKYLRPEIFAPSLREFLALLSQCRALIGNEGGAVNMAKALNVPCFAIFSPWIPKEGWAIREHEGHQSVHLKDYRPELFTNKSGSSLKKQYKELYGQFSPELFADELKDFLKRL